MMRIWMRGRFRNISSSRSEFVGCPLSVANPNSEIELRPRFILQGVASPFHSKGLERPPLTCLAPRRIIATPAR